eukprot:TRINITY_DN3535_c0_g1_i1.p1 TRINITY_DN3535_c0_g1~~TRINITY_DN3535_c0_g1_i1.p1  ORF type:complete len:496 (+),score=77.92 TRINITY_DN3535_c0_g1_i1:92-1489(+)
MLAALSCEVVCVQECKLPRSQFASHQPVCLVDGWDSFFSFCRAPTAAVGGYSGVATFVKHGCRFPALSFADSLCASLQAQSASSLPEDAPFLAHLATLGETEILNSLETLDGEGRVAVTDHGAFVLFNVYVPAITSEENWEDREKFKRLFLRLLALRVDWMQRSGRAVVLCGDLNISHRPIDSSRLLESALQDPLIESSAHQFRDWLDSFLMPCPSQSRVHFVDLFRLHHPTRENAYTCWNTKQSARQTNFGTRIDYILASADLATHFCETNIRPDLQGSDHCPVLASAYIPCAPGTDMPQRSPCSAWYLPEIRANRQTTLHMFQESTAKRRHVELTPLSDGDDDVVEVIEFHPSKKRKAAPATINSYFVPSVIQGVAPAQSQPDVFETAPQPKSSSVLWQQLLGGAPLCHHRDRAIERTVTKGGVNQGKKFFVCPRPQGSSSDPKARCDFFMWADELRHKAKKH